MSKLALFFLAKASIETLYMVFMASFMSIFAGLILGTFLFVTEYRKNNKNTFIHRILGASVNITRSVPFIILMISVIPLTHLLVGTTIGINAAIVPLTIAAIPFFARICQSALKEVPFGLLEAAEAMGASTSQIVTKVLLPESLPALIRGATLTIIGLIGYSAMAGVVGGGGLGELAINYGYQRFNVMVMLETVCVLIVMVQLIQMLGDKLAQQKRVKALFFVSILLWIFCLSYQLWPTALSEQNTLKIGVMSGWPEEVMQVASQVANKDYGIKLKIVPFSDYVQPNTALSNASIDANIFQHTPYLQAQMQAYHYKLTAIAKTFVYPMGFYSQKIQTLAQLPDHALIAIPNDPSNGGRALLILQKAKLIQLKSDVGTLASVNDIVANPHHFRFKLLDAAQLPRVLKDADLVAITNDFVNAAGLTVNQALLRENNDSPYANIIVVRTENKNKAIFKKLILIMHSKPVLEKTESIFPHGAALPAWQN